MVVHLGALVSHAVNTNDALVRANAWTSFDPCLVLLGAPSWVQMLCQPGESTSKR